MSLAPGSRHKRGPLLHRTPSGYGGECALNNPADRGHEQGAGQDNCAERAQRRDSQRSPEHASTGQHRHDHSERALGQDHRGV